MRGHSDGAARAIPCISGDIASGLRMCDTPTSHMAEVPLLSADLRGVSPARDRQSCDRCAGPRVQAVMMTSLVVYLRCEGCGEVWSIPQRRRRPRTDDPRGF